MTDHDAPLPPFPLALFTVVVEPAEIDRAYEQLREFCHEARNRLNALKLSLYLARRRHLADDAIDWVGVERHYKALETFVEEFHTTCRPARLRPIRMDLGLFLREKVAGWGPWFEERGRTLDLVEPQERAEGQFDPSAIGLALDAVARWRAEEGPPEAPCRLIYWIRDGEFTLIWDEPLSGRPHEIPREPSMPASLALPMTARIVAAHGGEVRLWPSEGWRVRLRWPVRGPAAPGRPFEGPGPSGALGPTVPLADGVTSP